MHDSAPGTHTASSSWFATLRGLLVGLLGWCGSLAVAGHARGEATLEQFFGTYCLDCHSGSDPSADLAWDDIDWTALGPRAESLELAVRQLSARQMPPLDALRPAAEETNWAIAELSARLDAIAAQAPAPGRTDSLRRMSRSEYQNAIRDLLALEIDAQQFLPADEASHGFDNVTVGELSPTLLNRYISAARKISRLAIGSPLPGPVGDTYRVKPDVTQEAHQAGLPLGTRGGLLLTHTFPRSGEYELEVRLARDRNEEVEGLHAAHQLLLLVDRDEVGAFTVKPPKDRDHSRVDAHVRQRVNVAAGAHQVGVTFLSHGASLIETMRQPTAARFNMHRHPRLSPAVFQVSITGPYTDAGPAETASRRKIFSRYPASPDEESACAEHNIGEIVRQAFRREPTAEDLAGPLDFYRQAREAGGNFEAGIESALNSILVSPHFLFRIERDPPQAAPGQVYRISDTELASRLSFFVWSSLPDDALLELAGRGELHQPEILEQQTRRMLRDPRSQSLVNNFAAQWLYLRNLDSITPDMRLFPDFDDNLRQAFREETERLFARVVDEDGSVLELLASDSTFVNERLAKHYGIPHVYGSRFRRIELEPDVPRGGLLRHGSLLTVTSYATRTSPVLRGHWILKNLVGAPPPPPPDDVPALEDNTVSSALPVRQRLAAHRENPACASCHDVMDPVGFALENYDAIGRWREQEAGLAVDASGGWPDGSHFVGVAGLEQALLDQPELFVGTLVEKLLTFGLGRGVEPSDAPAVRRILRDARAGNYRFSDLVVGITRSQPFTMRRAE